MGLCDKGMRRLSQGRHHCGRMKHAAEQTHTQQKAEAAHGFILGLTHAHWVTE